MAIMYLAKVNLTRGIYAVYDKKLNLKDIKQRIYDNLDNTIEYTTTTKMSYKDARGNSLKYTQNSVYGIAELKKYENQIITGKVIRRFSKPSEQVIDGKVVQTSHSEMVSIYFYFDVGEELIAFSERQTFGYNQFMKAFEYILNQKNPTYQFKIFLQKNNSLLREKIKELKIVKNMKATLIPPNSNEEDMNELRKAFKYLDNCKDMNANKMKIEMFAGDGEDSLNMDAKLINEVVDAVSNGYGEMVTQGFDNDGKKLNISSNQDAALTRIVNENLNEHDYDEEAKAFILSFAVNRIKALLK